MLVNSSMRPATTTTTFANIALHTRCCKHWGYNLLEWSVIYVQQEMYLGKYREEWVEIAESNHISRALFTRRVNSGYNFMYAATKPHRSAKWLEKGTEAMQNGVSRETFKQRLWRGHDIEDAASTPQRSVDMKYMLMRNDVIVSVGTIDEIAQERGVKRESIAYMISPSYHKRIRTNRAQRLVPFDAAY